MASAGASAVWAPLPLPRPGPPIFTPPAPARAPGSWVEGPARARRLPRPRRPLSRRTRVIRAVLLRAVRGLNTACPRPGTRNRWPACLSLRSHREQGLEVDSRRHPGRGRSRTPGAGVTSKFAFSAGSPAAAVGAPPAPLPTGAPSDTTRTHSPTTPLKAGLGWRRAKSGRRRPGAKLPLRDAPSRGPAGPVGSRGAAGDQGKEASWRPSRVRPLPHLA